MSENGKHTENKGPITDEDLHAFVDGDVSDKKREEIEAYLKTNSAKAEEVADWFRQNKAIKALFAHVGEEEIPGRLVPSKIATNSQNRTSAWRSLAAALALICIGGISGWTLRGVDRKVPDVTEVFIKNALEAHAIYSVEVNHPVEVSAREESHLIHWLSKRLRRKITVPDLSEAGFSLIGGRLLPGVERMAAQFMYEDKEGRRITLYTMRSDTGQLAAFRFKAEGDYQTFYWQDQDVSYAIVGNITRSTLKGLALQVYRQLS